jgi:hypothetical protein
MASPLPPQSPAGGLSPCYHSAHHGRSEDGNGNFSHFVWTPDDSHMANGYWRFETLEDECRAFARGFYKPEAILCAVSDHGGAFEDIILCWVPGRLDTNMTSCQVGSAAQHLMIILDLRRRLDKPLSFRSSTPVYPVDSRLKDYWSARRIAYGSPAQNTRPSLGVNQGAKVQHTPPSSPQLYSNQASRIANHGPSVVAKTSTRSQPQSQRMPVLTPEVTSRGSDSLKPLAISQPTSVALKLPATQGLQNASFGPNMQKTQAHRSSTSFMPQLHNNPYHKQGPPQLGELLKQVAPSNNPQQPLASSRSGFPTTQSVQQLAPNGTLSAQPVNTPQQPLTFLHPNLDLQSTLASEAAPSSTPATSTPLSAHGADKQSSSASDKAPLWSVYSPYISYRGRVSPYAPTPAVQTAPTVQHSLSQRPEYRAETHEENLPMTLDNDLLDIQPFHEATFPVDSDLSKGTQAPIGTVPSIKTPQNPACDNGRSSTVPTATPKSNGSRVGALQAPTSRPAMSEILHVKSPKRPMVVEQDPSWQNKKKANGRYDVQVAHPTRVIPPATITATSPELSTKRPAKRFIVPGPDDLLQNKRSQVNGPDHVQATSPEVLVPSTATDMYPGLPCMDCGEETGHKWDCYVGSKFLNLLVRRLVADSITDFKPKQNLTLLDYRALAESVTRFDPGPWTTHQGPPFQPGPEDQMEQIRGIAEVIRNESSYGEDAQLHALPDEAMIMLWAFKASPDVEVVCE